MFVAPAGREMVATGFRGAAMTRGVVAVRVWERSSSKFRSRVRCGRSSVAEVTADDRGGLRGAGLCHAGGGDRVARR